MSRMRSANKKDLKARKIKGCLIEPIKEGYSAKWEGHHATNPSAIRLSGPRECLRQKENTKILTWWNLSDLVSL